jgi:hypothetical protein
VILKGLNKDPGVVPGLLFFVREGFACDQRFPA